MANKNVKLKDSFGNYLFPQTLLGNIKTNEGDAVVIITDANKASYVVTRIKMNGGYIGNTGEIDLGTVITTLPTVDQTYNSVSTNAQSGVAVAGAISGKQDSLGFTPENVANKKTTMSDNDTDYPTTKAVKTFVNSSIASQTGTFKGTYDVVTDLGLSYGATHQQIATALETVITGERTNDYCFAINKDANNNIIYERFKYTGSEWSYEYSLNNSSFTATQWNAINSGINSTTVSQIGTNTGNISTLSGQVNGILNGTNIDNFSEVETALSLKANSSELSNYVPTTRTVNGKALSANITLTASDVSALPSSTTYVSSINGSSGTITGIATTAQLSAKQDTLTPGAGIEITNTNVINVVNGVYFEEVA